VYRGYTIPPHYDSMLAKLIVRGNTWDETVRRMHRSLSEYVIRGVKTTIPYYKKVMEDPKFISGNFTTSYVEEQAEKLLYKHEKDPNDMAIAIAAAIVAHSKV
jgi:pyruvate carboxylase subunit A